MNSKFLALFFASLIFVLAVFSIVLVNQQQVNAEPNDITEPEVPAEPINRNPGDPSVIPSFKLDYPTVMRNQSGTAYLMINFDVDNQPVKGDVKKPLNLGLVIDRSGSMADAGKMDYTKKAACYMIDQLSPDTRLAMVEYDDEITVMTPSIFASKKDILKGKINELSPRGSTNLHGGMMRGVKEIQGYGNKDNISRVILMSDGLANQGVTDLRSILSDVREIAGDGISITTMGVGLDYNEILMEEIAKTSGGNYYFIEHPEQINYIYEEEINSLYQMVTSDLQLAYDRGNNVSSFKVFGYNLDDNGNVICNNFYVGEKRLMVFRFDYIGASEPFSLGTITLKYFDIKAEKMREFKYDIRINVTDSPEIVEEHSNRDVIIESEMRETEEKMEVSTEYVRNSNFSSARSTMNDQINELKSKNKKWKSSKVNLKIEALEVELEQINLSEKDKSTQRKYMKASRSRQYSQSQGDMKSISMQVGDKGKDVKILQKALKDKGYYKGKIDGFFSKELEEALIKFQQDNNLPPDGKAGPKTQALLNMY